MALEALRISAGSEATEESPGGFAGVEEYADAVVRVSRVNLPGHCGGWVVPWVPRCAARCTRSMCFLSGGGAPRVSDPDLGER